MDIMLIINIVCGILFAYFIIFVSYGVLLLSKYMAYKFLLFLLPEKVTKNVVREFNDYLKEENND